MIDIETIEIETIEIEIPVFVETYSDGNHDAWIYATGGRRIVAGLSDEALASYVANAWEQSSSQHVVKRHVVWIKTRVPVPPESPVVTV